jgi:hypothetical protein
VNAAFLLVTSAWLAGGQTAAPPPPAPMAPAAPYVATAAAPSGGCGCGSTCGCNDCEKPGFLERMRGRFHKDKDCGCAPATTQSCAPAPVYHAAPCASCGSTCDSCEHAGFLDRLRARFHRDNDCGCNSCGAPACSSCGAAPLPPAKVGEPIKGPAEGPKKLPEGDKPKETSSPKNLELTPTGAGDKIIESGTKNPF